MKVLGIESSGHVASIGLMEDGCLKSEFTINNGLTHSETLMPMLQQLMELSGECIGDMDAVAVSAGPGSFTGLRIGAATAKGLALAIQRPIVAVSSLEALAFNLHASKEALICPIMDARRGQVYRAAFMDGRCMIPEGAESMEGFIQRLNELTDAPGTYIFLGDGVPVYEKLIAERMNGGYLFADAQDALQRAASVAQLGIWRYQEWLHENMLEASDIKEKGIEHISCFNDIVMDPDDFVPHYIRKPQAERELEAGLLEDPGLHSLKKMNGEKHGRMHKAT